MLRKLTIDFNKTIGAIKPMHATNNGPVISGAFSKNRSGNFRHWQEAGIPYARTHDSSFCANYGGEHTVDVHAIFPNFDADVNDPASYDFTITDEYVGRMFEFGTKVFYRLGTKIEHEVKKYNIHPPKDFKKWAEICEHIIMHYTQGWANGFHHDIEYWEIWNEPDLDAEDSPKQRTWTGTDQQFFEFYEIAATHLKSRFPHLKIGGPAVAGSKKWIEAFFKYITRDGKRVPLDFFSWHIYTSLTEKMMARSVYVRNLMDEYGYTDAESILNEWNYIQSWDNFNYSVKHIISIKGAAFTSACMCMCQNDTSVDLLMYYDARPSAYNGLFDFYTNEPLKGYYPFKMFNELYRKKNACKCTFDEGNGLYAAAATSEDGKAVMISYFVDDDNCKEPYDIQLDFTDNGETYELILLDKDHDAEAVKQVKNGEQITLFPNTVCLLKTL